jgi:hypothetical protein
MTFFDYQRLTPANDRFGELCCTSKRATPQMRRLSASAIAAPAQVRFVHDLILGQFIFATVRTNGGFLRCNATAKTARLQQIPCCERTQREN